MNSARGQNGQFRRSPERERQPPRRHIAQPSEEPRQFEQRHPPERPSQTRRAEVPGRWIESAAEAPSSPAADEQRSRGDRHERWVPVAISRMAAAESADETDEGEARWRLSAVAAIVFACTIASLMVAGTLRGELMLMALGVLLVIPLLLLLSSRARPSGVAPSGATERREAGRIEKPARGQRTP